MAKDFNKITVTGHLGADPEMRYTQNGTAVTNFRIACSNTRTRDGETVDETIWFRVVAWQKLAEVCNQYLFKGSRVLIEGRLAEREWVDKEGVARKDMEIVASDMIMLSTKRETTPSAADAPSTNAPAPRAPSRPAPVAPMRRNAPQPITSDDDDDIPF